jgi:hypothetical protein
MMKFGKVTRGVGPYWLDDGTKLVQRAERPYVDRTKGRVTVQAFAERWFKKAQQGVGARRGSDRRQVVRDPLASTTGVDDPV